MIYLKHTQTGDVLRFVYFIAVSRAMQLGWKPANWYLENSDAEIVNEAMNFLAANYSEDFVLVG